MMIKDNSPLVFGLLILLFGACGLVGAFSFGAQIRDYPIRHAEGEVIATGGPQATAQAAERIAQSGKSAAPADWLAGIAQAALPEVEESLASKVQSHPNHRPPTATA